MPSLVSGTHSVAGLIKNLAKSEYFGWANPVLSWAPQLLPRSHGMRSALLRRMRDTAFIRPHGSRRLFGPPQHEDSRYTGNPFCCANSFSEVCGRAPMC
jgi:hypothetical protein